MKKRTKRTRTSKLHPDNVRAAWAFVQAQNPQLQIFRTGNGWSVQVRENTSQIKWACVACEATRPAVIVRAAEKLGWKLRRQKKES